jgi:hypothetical protein
LVMATPKRKKPLKKRYHNLIHNELPINARGDRNMDELAKAVAYALSTWETMDERMSFLFSILVQSQNGAAAAAYGALNSFGAQVRMVRAASEAVFRRGDPLRDKINQALGDVSDLHGKRSNIAHGIIREYVKHSADKLGRQRASSSGFFLSPPMHNTRKKFSIDELNDKLRASPAFFGEFHRWQRFAYTSKQVAQITKVFRHYERQMLDIYVEVQAEMAKRAAEKAVKLQAKGG